MSETDRRIWDERYRDPARPLPSEITWIADFKEEIPAEGNALDLASGSGAGALALARLGLSALAVDVSEVGLRLAERRLADAGFSLRTERLDLREELLPPGPFAAISCFHYHQPDLIGGLRELLQPGGVLLLELVTCRNLERHPRPPERFVYEPGEALALCTDLDIVYYREGWLDDRHVSRVIARRDYQGGRIQ